MRAPLSRTATARRPVDLVATLGPLRGLGRLDPCVRIGPAGVWRATDTPAGPATVHIRSCDSHTVEAHGWGPGADAALDALPALIGADDDPPSLAGRHPMVTEAARRFPGLRVGRTGAVLEALVPTVLAQKVIGVEAASAYRALVREAARPAPGPWGQHSGDARSGAAAPLFVPPSPECLRSVPSWKWHRWGVEYRRAATIALAASYAGRLEETTSLPLPQARGRLGALPGVGPWTVNEVAAIAWGDPDAVSVGDYWLAHQVCFALTGESRGSDERMLELLEPWTGQRGRVCRLLLRAGPPLPRYGPKLSLREIADT